MTRCYYFGDDARRACGKCHLCAAPEKPIRAIRLHAPPPVPDLEDAVRTEGTRLVSDDFGARAEPGFIGLGPITIPAGGTVSWTTHPQRRFRPTRMTAHPECASALWLVDLIIGMDSAFTTANPVPLACFPPIPLHMSPRDLGDWIRGMSSRFKICEIGQRLQLCISNRTTANALFSGVLWGDVDFT